MEILLQTIHGSRLYGLHHAESDYDYYTVIPTRRGVRKRNAKQKIIGNRDTFVIDMSTFMVDCDKGVPQALEALFSEQATIDNISEFRHNFTINTGNIIRSYRRTIKNFAEGDFKKKRHALRLALNLDEAVRYGKFNPTLSQDDADWISTLANHPDYEFYLGELTL